MAAVAAANDFENSRGWDLIAEGSTTTPAAADDFFSVFPPSLHEGLSPTLALTLTESSHQFQESIAKKETEAPHVSRTSISESTWRIVDAVVEVVRSKITNLKAGGRGAVWSFAAAAGLVGVLLYMRRRHRRERELLFFLILEKDKKISQLVHQIVQMSEIITSQHKVPSLNT